MTYYKNFKHLHVPDHWEHYWSKYPQGYTIMEALISWVSQVDRMTDNVNDWNNYLDQFVATFDTKLQDTVREMVQEMYNSGKLAELTAQVIDVVQDQINSVNDDVNALENKTNGLTSQLAQKAILINSFPRLEGETTDTERIQRAIDYASEKGLNLYGSPDETYIVSSITIKNGLKSFICKGILKGVGSTPHNEIVRLDDNEKVKDCYISLNIDMSSGDGFGIVANGGCDNCTFEGNYIYNMTDNVGASRFGILLGAGSNNNKIINNKIVGYENRTNPANAIILIGVFGESVDYGGFFNDGNIVSPTKPCVGNIISNNTLIFGEVAVDLLACEENIVTNNYCYKQKTRSIYLANSTNNCVVNNNELIGFGSSGVLLTFGSNNNTVQGNKVKQIKNYNPYGAEAGINVTTGAYDNIISNNTVETMTNYGIYLAVNVIGNIVDSNKVTGHYLAGIALENDYQDTPPSGARYSKPNYEPPYVGSKWASKDTSKNIIQNNVIGEGYPQRDVGGIYVSQLGSTSTSENTIQNNTILEQLANTWSLYFYEETSEKMFGNFLTNNRVYNVNVLRQFLSRGKKHFTQCYGNDGVDTSKVFLPSGVTTPDVGKGMIFDCSNNMTPTAITDFLNGIQGQKIIIKLNKHTSINYAGGKIFTKNSVNIVGSESLNEYVTFLRDGNAWREIYRSF